MLAENGPEKPGLLYKSTRFGEVYRAQAEAIEVASGQANPYRLEREALEAAEQAAEITAKPHELVPPGSVAALLDKIGAAFGRLPLIPHNPRI